MLLYLKTLYKQAEAEYCNSNASYKRPVGASGHDVCAREYIDNKNLCDDL